MFTVCADCMCEVVTEMLYGDERTYCPSCEVENPEVINLAESEYDVLED